MAAIDEDLSYILQHLGEAHGDYMGAVSPPIFQTSNFAFASVEGFRQAIADEYASTLYTRGQNPTAAILRRKLAALEGTEDALVFGSGAAAIAAAVLSVVRSGDEVVCVAKPYSWTRILLRDLLPRFGARTIFVDGTDPAHFAAALSERTRLIVLESPNSMTLELQDLAAVGALARSRGILSLIDNSYASPLLQRPAEFGIDLIAHSATKYLNGHSDVVAGVLCGSERLLRDVFQGPYMTLGAILGPFEAWLMLRGLRTLELRMQRIASTARAVSDWLARHPRVERLIDPGHPSHPQYALAQRQMRGASGLLSIQLCAPDLAAVERFSDRLRCFLMAVSWGGHESLQFPAAALIRGGDAARERLPLPWNLVRLSIGLESPELLIADLEQALEGAW